MAELDDYRLRLAEYTRLPGIVRERSSSSRPARIPWTSCGRDAPSWGPSTRKSRPAATTRPAPLRTALSPRSARFFSTGTIMRRRAPYRDLDGRALARGPFPEAAPRPARFRRPCPGARPGLILYAEHEFNASTFAARVIAGTGSDLHSAVCGAIGALRGPKHGGANEVAIEIALVTRPRTRPRPTSARAWPRARSSSASAIPSTRSPIRATRSSRRSRGYCARMEARPGSSRSASA